MDDKNILEIQTELGEKKELIDPETGEIILVDQITKKIYGQKNFWKIYLLDFMTVLGIIDNRQLDVFIYIAENTNASNNLFIGTYKKINKDLGVAESTIARIMKKLQSNNFIKKVQNGVWLVNPNIIMKGNDHKRQILLSYFENDKPVNELTFSRTKTKPLKVEKSEIKNQKIISKIEESLKEMEGEGKE
jgi:firmicute plasmid replication protein